MSEAPAPIKCDSCGTSPAYEYVSLPFNPTLCVKCCQTQALRDAAHTQLRHQIERVCREWWAVWGNVEGVAYLGGVLATIGEDLDEELNATRKEASL